MVDGDGPRIGAGEPCHSLVRLGAIIKTQPSSGATPCSGIALLCRLVKDSEWVGVMLRRQSRQKAQ
jgi:hypothetical protein